MDSVECNAYRWMVLSVKGVSVGARSLMGCESMDSAECNAYRWMVLFLKGVSVGARNLIWEFGWVVTSPFFFWLESTFSSKNAFL